MLYTDLPLVGLEESSVGHGVEEGPEAGVAAAIVVVVETLTRESHGDHLPTRQMTC